jgi:hypothetical protein
MRGTITTRSLNVKQTFDHETRSRILILVKEI